MLSSVKNKIEIIKTEIEGKQEQVAVLPERKKELKELLSDIDTEQKLSAVGNWIQHFGGQSAVEEHLERTSSGMPRIRSVGVKEHEAVYAAFGDLVSF